MRIPVTEGGEVTTTMRRMRVGVRVTVGAIACQVTDRSYTHLKGRLTQLDHTQISERREGF